MDPLRMIVDEMGFFTRAMARDCGYDDRSVAAMVRAKIWRRVRRGYYVFADEWASLDPVGRHLVVCRCVLHSLGNDVALSHLSGALAHGLSCWNVNLSRVHVTRLDGGAGRLEAGVVHHEGLCLDDDVTTVDGMRVLKAARCALEAGSLTTNEGALVVLDSALFAGLADEDEILRQFESMSSWPHMRHLHIPVRMTTPLSQSVGESRGRWLFWTLGLPAPQCQFEVYDAQGVLVATCDWGWPGHGLLGEFDGLQKYGRLLKPGQSPGEVMFAEKRREDLLRELTGMRMVRLVWDDYDRPRVTGTRITRLMRAAG
jgi:hypothetical protein